MNELALFAGAGGGILGGHLLGWRTVCAVECDAYAAQVLGQRQNDGALPAFPIWSDVCSFDGTHWRGLVDVVSGGFPCQDISVAGSGAGLAGERSGLWEQMRRIIGEVRPSLVLVENSPALTSRGLGRVLGDLAELGFDAEWGVLGASDLGAPHRRKRIWIVAYSNSLREPQQAWHEQECGMGFEQRGEAVADADSDEWQRGSSAMQVGRERIAESDEKAGYPTGTEWPPEPSMGRVADGVAHRLDRLRALGNGQVPRVAAAAFNYLAGRN